MLNRRQLMQAALSTSALNGAQAQTPFPSRPLRIIVPFGAGGVADLTARAVGQALAASLGQAVIIDNRPGAGGLVAGELVAKVADGKSVFFLDVNPVFLRPDGTLDPTKIPPGAFGFGDQFTVAVPADIITSRPPPSGGEVRAWPRRGGGR